MKKITKELEKLLERASKKLEQAQDARADVMAYLEDHYDIDTYEDADTLEEECIWCYGIDISAIQRMIERTGD